MLIDMGTTGNRTTHSKGESSFSSAHNSCENPSKSTRVLEALSDLHELLEEYAPSWYTEEHHRKAESALHPKKALNGGDFTPSACTPSPGR